MKTTHRIAILVLAIAGAAGIAGCQSTRTQESTGQYLDDTAITGKVKAAIFNEPSLKSAEIKGAFSHVPGLTDSRPARHPGLGQVVIGDQVGAQGLELIQRHHVRAVRRGVIGRFMRFDEHPGDAQRQGASGSTCIDSARGDSDCASARSSGVRGSWGMLIRSTSSATGPSHSAAATSRFPGPRR